MINYAMFNSKQNLINLNWIEYSWDGFGWKADRFDLNYISFESNDRLDYIGLGIS